MTNREWLNSLNDEELAEIYLDSSVIEGIECSIFCKEEFCECNQKCKENITKWLKAEKKEEI